MDPCQKNNVEKKMNITLPSNSSMEYYPDNSLTSFRTHFDSPLLLPEAYEAALTEIILPTEWSNVHDDELFLCARRVHYLRR